MRDLVALALGGTGSAAGGEEREASIESGAGLTAAVGVERAVDCARLSCGVAGRCPDEDEAVLAVLAPRAVLRLREAEAEAEVGVEVGAETRGRVEWKTPRLVDEDRMAA